MCEWAPLEDPGSDEDRAPREVGSDFEAVESRLLRANGGQLPWEGTGTTVYVQSGRQALMLLQQLLRSDGYDVVHLASYVCDSVVQAFTQTGWTIRQLPVDRDLRVDAAVVEDRVNEGVYLHTPYFGRGDTAAIALALSRLRTRGVVVVADETHRVLSPGSTMADFHVASLRKMLPVCDGGYLWSRGAVPTGGLEPADDRVTKVRASAMREKLRALRAGDASGRHREMFAEAEDAVQQSMTPRCISTQSLALLRRLDLELVRSLRERNAAVLFQELRDTPGLRVINPPSDVPVPSHLVIEADRPRDIQNWMAAERLYCPIHWPPSMLLPRIHPWPSRYLSLPIDQRYGETDMYRLAGRLRDYFRQTERTTR